VLRDGLGDPGTLPATLSAVLDHLCAHEPDLVAAADALGVAPGDLAAARERLNP
jgi:adenine/guanine phosphoribosyltransferase-like PRPP-binding protein